MAKKKLGRSAELADADRLIRLTEELQEVMSVVEQIGMTIGALLELPADQFLDNMIPHLRRSLEKPRECGPNDWVQMATACVIFAARSKLENR